VQAQSVFQKYGAVTLVAIITFATSAWLISLALSMRTAAHVAYHTPPLAIIIHLITVIPSIPLGAYVLARRKGDALHKFLGRLWGVLMVTTSIDSFWIRSVTGHISPIHIFSIVTLISIPLGVYHIRNGNPKLHYQAMRNTYIGLCMAGIFAFTPGRMIGHLIFGW
jgi:uncharacterized membrane protein